MFRRFAGAAVIILTLAAPAFADDWQAVKLRGIVLQLVENQWQPLQRGDIVPDSRVIRTTQSGRVEFTRGAETIDLEPNTQIQIIDKAHHQKPYTTINQYFGTVSVEAEVQNVQHFAVDTPFLAAVVKGTKFVVGTETTGGSVKVNRGHVAVTDKLNKTKVLLAVGQSALIDTVKTGGALLVQGKGDLPPVLDSHNRPVGGDGSGDTSDGSGQSGIGLNLGGLGGVTVGGNNGLANVNVGGLAGVTVGGDNGVANVNVGGSNGVSLNVGGGGGLVNVGAGAGSSGSSGGGLVNVNVGGSGGDSGNTGNLVNLNLGHLHLGL